MGIDISDRLEAFASSNSSKNGRDFAKTLAAEMWGDRTLRYNKVSRHDRKSKEPYPRLSLEKKDPDGFKIFKGKKQPKMDLFKKMNFTFLAAITAWDAACNLVMIRNELAARMLNEGDIASAVAKREKELKNDKGRRLDSLLGQANAYGLMTFRRV